MDIIMDKLKNFMNKDGQLTAFPAKRKLKIYCLHYIASKLTPGVRYTEKELNAEIDKWTEFHDPATLRREMYDYRFLGREDNSTYYWLEDEMPEIEL